MVGEIETVLSALNRAGVRYLVVGGVAVVLHGLLRTTADLDLVLHLERENVLRAMRALESVGYRPRAPVAADSFADEATRRRWADEKGLTVFSMWSPAHPALEVDIFVAEPLPFEVAYARAIRVPLERTEATLVSLDDLIALKRLAGRPMDLQDIAGLEALRRDPEEGESDATGG